MSSENRSQMPHQSLSEITPLLRASAVEGHGPDQNDDKSVTPPDGGLRAWLVVMGAFFVWFNTWGLINAFGVFQTHYQVDLLKRYSPSEIAWIGSVQNFLVLFVGFVSGPLFDAGLMRISILVGSLLTVVGMVALSFAEPEQYHQFFLAQAITVGLGWGLVFTPTASIPSTYFTTKLPAATGIAAAGTGIGGIVYSVVFRKVQQNLGFSGTVRIMSSIILVTLLVSIFVLRPNGPPTTRRRYVDWTAFKELKYNTFLLSGVFTMAGLSVPFYYIQLYAMSMDLTDQEIGWYLVAVINAGSTIGRLIPPILSFRVGAANMNIVCFYTTATLCFSLIAARSLNSLLTVAALYGFFSGAIVALSPVVLIQMTPDRALVGTRLGMAFTIPAFGVLLGTPISGAILHATGGFAGVWLFGGVCIAVGAVLMTGSRVAHAGLSPLKKV